MLKKTNRNDEAAIEDFRKRVLAAVRPEVERDYGGSRVLDAIRNTPTFAPKVTK